MIPLLIASVSGSASIVVVEFGDVFDVTIPAGAVEENLTDFPLMVVLDDMPAGFWTAVQDDGGNIRAFEADGTTPLALDLTQFDAHLKKGRLFIKTDLTALTPTIVKIECLTAGALTLPAVDAATGRNEVWADYEMVQVFPEEVDRTGATRTYNFRNETPSLWKKTNFRRLSGDPHQGVTTDGTNFWSVDTNEIRRMNMSYSVLNSDLDVAATMLADASTEINHLGDPVVVGNRLFTTATFGRTGGGNYHRYIVEFNATTLAYVTHTEIGVASGNDDHVFGATVCYDGTNLVLFSYTDGTRFRRYTLDGVFVDEITMSADQGEGIQGSTVLPDGRILIATDDDDTVREVMPNGTVNGVVYSDPHGAINEGLEYDETTDTLYLLLGDGDMVTLDREGANRDYSYHHFQTTDISIAATSTVWTAGGSITWAIGSGDSQEQFFAWDGYTSYMYDEGPDRIGMWNPTDSWLHSNFNPTGFQTWRGGYMSNGTTDRAIWADGVKTYDAGPVAIQPEGASGKFIINSGSDAASTDNSGMYQYVWLRYEVMSDAWMKADAANMNDPSNFYNVTLSGVLPTFNGANIVVQQSAVGETLTDFPLRIHLENMPSLFWDDAFESDGSDIRIYAADGVTLIPHDMAYYNSGTRKGDVYCKVTLSPSADTTVVLKRDGTGGTLAAGDTNGRNAVWTDYEVVWSFPEEVNRTGTVLTQDLTGIEDHTDWFRTNFFRLSGDPHQGIATDGVGTFISIDTDHLRKMDATFTQTAANATPIADTGIVGVNHLGDGCIVGSEFISVLEDYPSGPYTNQHIVVFNVSDLSFNRSYDISSEGHEVSSICFDGTDYWITDFTDDTVIYRYSTTGTRLATVTLSSPIVDMQGIEYVRGNFYITSFAATREVYEVQPDGTVLGVVYIAPEAGELEGLTFDQNNTLYVMDEVGDLTTLEWGLLGGSRKAHYDYGTVTLPQSQVFTASASVFFSQFQQQTAFLGISNGSSASNSAAILYDAGPDHMDVWDIDNSWLDPPTEIDPAQYTQNRLAYSYNGSTSRTLWNDGVALDTQTGNTAKPSGGGTDMEFNINSSRNNGVEMGENYYQFIWLRTEAMSNNWMAADAINSEDPASFYEVEAF